MARISSKHVILKYFGPKPITATKFIIGGAMKIAVLVSWRTTPMSLCKSKICSLKFKKDFVILKMLLWILCFWSYAPCKLLSHFHYG